VGLISIPLRLQGGENAINGRELGRFESSPVREVLQLTEPFSYTSKKLKLPVLKRSKQRQGNQHFEIPQGIELEIEVVANSKSVE